MLNALFEIVAAASGLLDLLLAFWTIFLAPVLG